MTPIPRSGDGTTDIEPNTRKSALRKVSAFIIAASLGSFALELWDFIQHKAQWSKPIFPLGMFLLGLCLFLDPERGRLRKIGVWVANALMFLSLGASFLGW